jgi:hypothetical protein
MTTVIPLQDAELNKKIRGSDQDGKRYWKVQGTYEEAVAYTALAVEVPETIEGPDGQTLYLNKVECSADEADLWDGVAHYISEELKEEQEQKEKEKDPPDEVEWDFDTTGGKHHITSSFGTRVFSVFQNNEPFNSYGNAINVKRTKTGFEVKGTEVVIPQLEFSGTVPYPAGTITLDWIKNIARATGKTNSAVWHTFDAGEILFLGAHITAKSWKKTVVRFNFSASENIVAAMNIKVGAIGPIVKPGHAYQWVEYENVDELVDGAQVIFPKPRYVFVETIYREFDLNQLPIP